MIVVSGQGPIANVVSVAGRILREVSRISWRVRPSYACPIAAPMQMPRHPASMRGSRSCEGVIRSRILLANGGPTATDIPSAIAAGPTPTRRILVVDDEEAVARNFARMLAPHSVDVAHNGRQALERCASSRYDVVICDLMMPDVTGMEVYTRLVAADPTAASRFLFMTGGAFTDKAREFLDRTPVRCLEKPCSKADLHAAVAEAVAAAG